MSDLCKVIDAAAETVGAAWPIHSFVAANPLAGLDELPFDHAVAAGEALFGARGYPDADTFRWALLETGRIDPDILKATLREHDLAVDPAALLDRMAAESPPRPEPPTAVDRVLAKWLAAFLDEGHAPVGMPGRADGFYAAWRAVAPHDAAIPALDTPLPETPLAAIEGRLPAVPRDELRPILEHHFAALPGWTAFINRRVGDGHDPWQARHPIAPADYLAVRLSLCAAFEEPVVPADPVDVRALDPDPPLAAAWLAAWERSYRARLLDHVADPADEATDAGRPAAQLVFCIDTRSEIIRRHVEAAARYETFGYAGFFGIPMRYTGPDDPGPTTACPPIVDPLHHVADANGTTDGFLHEHLRGLKSNVAAAFPFVEATGTAYAGALAVRTFRPDLRRLVRALVDRPARDEPPRPVLATGSETPNGQPGGIPLADRIAYAEAAVRMLGIDEFARLVVFVGHAADCTNNAFAASLDCGACAGNPGGPNARVLAAICNDPAVRAALADRGHPVPSDTVFLAGEHNTTTDEIRLFDADVPESHRADLERLAVDLDRAGDAAAAERVPALGDDGVHGAVRRATDWAEPRPEWGLAGNAGFVVGPRSLTAGENLGGRTFLHAYDWRSDPDGDVLQDVLAGPVAVAGWINAQYYFASVDNDAYGSGSKITQNPVGNVGVHQGNGGDLRAGLPRESVRIDDETPFHPPLRLSVIVHAPVERVAGALGAERSVARPFDGGWMSLTVIDPERGDVSAYEDDGEWTPTISQPLPA